MARWGKVNLPVARRLSGEEVFIGCSRVPERTGSMPWSGWSGGGDGGHRGARFVGYGGKEKKLAR
jgi:hypothetical protein